MDSREPDAEILIFELDYIRTLSYITRPCWLRLNKSVARNKIRTRSSAG